MSLTVTAQQGGSTQTGIEAVLLDITGQSATPLGSAPAGVTSATPDVAITPDITGSLIVGTLLATGLALTALTGTTFYETPSGGGLRFGPFHGTSAAGGTPQTMGSSTGTGISAVAIEIKSSPTVSSATLSGFVAATSVALGPITPAAGDLLVLLVASNGASGVTTMQVTDTSGLTWAEHVPQQGAGNGYTGIWTVIVPAAGAPNGTVQPRATVPVPRRQPSRAYTRFTPVATVNAQLFFQQPAGQAAVFSRRVPARAFIGRLKAITGVNAPTTPGQVKPLTARSDWPRRVPSRAYVRFIPVVTVNGPAPPVPPGTGGTANALDDWHHRWRKRRIGRFRL